MAVGTLARRGVVLLTPLALVAIELTHPATVFDTSPNWWITIHLIQMPLFGLIALAAYLLVEETVGIFKWLAVASLLTFTIYYTALDAVAGITVGILIEHARSLAPDQRAIVNGAIAALYGWNGIQLFFNIGRAAWIVGLVACAAALRSAARPWPPLVILALSGLPIFWDHARPYGPIAFGLFFVAAAWLELLPRTDPNRRGH